MKTYKARGIVLHTVKYGDSSLVAFVLTDVLGRQSYMVQGVKSAKGKGNKAAMLQPMFLLEFEGLQTPHAAMHRMKDVRMPHPLQNVPFDVRKSTIALFMAETLYRLIKEVEPNSPLFEFVRESVLALDRLEEGVANFHLWFLVQMSSFLGFYPANEYTSGDYFDIAEGCFCPVAPRHGAVVNQPNATLLDTLMNCDAADLGTLTLSRRQRGDFLASLLHYFGYHLDSIGSVRSIAILSEVF
jgi:DNA repair protein RecO (recombination protein O)